MANSVYLRDSSSIKFDFMNCQFANLVLAQLYRISDTKTQNEDPDLLDTPAMGVYKRYLRICDRDRNIVIWPKWVWYAVNLKNRILNDPKQVMSNGQRSQINSQFNTSQVNMHDQTAHRDTQCMF